MYGRRPKSKSKPLPYAEYQALKRAGYKLVKTSAPRKSYRSKSRSTRRPF